LCWAIVNESDLILREVIINTEPVELYKLLKFGGLIDSGGMAKMVIDAGDVMVNGEVETRRRRKCYRGDIVEFAGETLKLIATGDSA
jgi:ribosome-associated protein